MHYTGGAKPSMLRIERLASTEELALPKRFSGDSVEELHQVRSTTASSVKTGEATGQSTPVKRCVIAMSDAVRLQCPMTLIKAIVCKTLSSAPQQ